MLPLIRRIPFRLMLLLVAILCGSAMRGRAADGDPPRVFPIIIGWSNEPNLGAGMRRLQGLHAARLNDRLGRNGHLWRDRFHSRVVDSDRYVLRAAIYIDLNPVEAGLTNRPGDWRWSSYRANAGLAEPPFWHRVDRLYEYVAAPPDDAPSVYREAVELANRALGGLEPPGA